MRIVFELNWIEFNFKTILFWILNFEFWILNFEFWIFFLFLFFQALLAPVLALARDLLLALVLAPVPCHQRSLPRCLLAAWPKMSRGNTCRKSFPPLAQSSLWISQLKEEVCVFSFHWLWMLTGAHHFIIGWLISFFPLLFFPFSFFVSFLPFCFPAQVDFIVALVSLSLRSQKVLRKPEITWTRVKLMEMWFVFNLWSFPETSAGVHTLSFALSTFRQAQSPLF